MMREYHHKNIRLPAAAYIGQKAYFITLCSANRRKVFTDPKSCNYLLQLLKDESAVRGFAIPAYCLMPDHLHLLAHGLQESSDLLSFVKSFRLKSSRAYARNSGNTLWEKKFFDHILRSPISLESVAWYIWMNPIRAGLSKSVGEYPFAGPFPDAESFRKQPEKIWEPDWKRGPLGL
jgi:REP element-mobilizing transposase RayT